MPPDPFLANSTRLTALCPAKVNLFLHITGRKPDGYHLLESVFCPVSLTDKLHLEIQPTPGRGLSISRSGPLAQLPKCTDLTYRAAQAFFETAQVSQEVAIHIHVQKHIPTQAGLGGGSSNAAHLLRLLQSHYQQPIAADKLQATALNLGADVPFFLQDQSAFVEGIGEVITPFKSPFLPILIYKPQLNCPTGQIFGSQELTRDSSPVKISVFDSWQQQYSPVEHPGQPQGATGKLAFWDYLRSNTQNSLQLAVAQLFPVWAKEFDTFNSAARENGSVLSRMSGSGSAMFALFETEPQRDLAAKQLQKLLGAFNGFCFTGSLL